MSLRWRTPSARFPNGGENSGDEETQPLARGSKDPAPKRSAETSSKPRSVAQSNEEFGRVRGPHVNTMHVRSTSLADKLKYRKFDVVVAVEDFIVQEFKLFITRSATSAGAFHLFDDLADGMWSRCIHKTWEKISDNCFLRDCGFELKPPCSRKQAQEHHECVDMLLKSLCSLSGYFLPWEKERTNGLPFYFVRLASGDESVVTEAPFT